MDLYSTSNINTPNRTPRYNKNEKSGEAADENGIEENNGRITMRSVHLSSTENMKGDTKDADVARIHHHMNQIDLSDDV